MKAENLWKPVAKVEALWRPGAWAGTHCKPGSKIKAGAFWKLAEV